MEQAVQLAVDHHSSDRPIPEILTKFLINRETIRNNRARTIDEYRCQLGKFVADFGGRPASGITASEIEDWLRAPHSDNKGRQRTWAGSRRNVTRGYIGTLFNFGIRKNLCTFNPIAGVDRAIVERAPIEVWSPAETLMILKVATQECSELLRFLVLAFFSGIRTGELFCLHIDHVKLDQAIVTVPASISKTRKLRNVPISKNLAAWLAQSNINSRRGRIWDMGETSLHRRYRLIEKSTGLKWRGNALRHTFASNHLALYDNEYLTSKACGNTPRMLRDYYDAVVSREHGEAHFSIFP
jgi:site-specific recombinase XerD